jgi:hypothetical protein
VGKGRTTELRRILKQRFYEPLVRRGFVLDTRHQPQMTTLRRRARDRVHLLDVAWDKYGRPRFSVTFGTCPAAGLQIRGELIPAGEMLASWCPDAGTLQGGSGAGWSFRQDANWLQRFLGRPIRDPATVVDDLLSIYPEVERYWAGGETGPHLRHWNLRR